MDKLQDKLLKLKETLEKGMKNGGIGGPGSVKAGAALPSIPQPKASGSTNSSTPSVGQAPQSKKNPIKQAQQVQNPDVKDRKMQEAQSAMNVSKQDYLEIFKADNNGQWSIEKAYKDRETAVPGVSEMGIEARRGTGKDWRETGYMRSTDAKTHKENARDIARQNLKETKSVKPKLPDAKKSDCEVEKSGYKGYTPEDNARRKANNLSEGTGIKSMDRIKQYGGSGPNAAAKEAAKMKAKSKKNPVKTYSKEEIDAINRERNLKKE